MTVFNEGTYARILDSYYAFYPQNIPQSQHAYATTTSGIVTGAESAVKPLCNLLQFICPLAILFYLGGGALLGYGLIKGFKKNYIAYGGVIVGVTFLATHACCSFKTTPVIPPRPAERSTSEEKAGTKPQTKPAAKPQAKSTADTQQAKATDPLSEIGNFFSNLLKSGADNFKSNVRGIGGEEVAPLA